VAGGAEILVVGAGISGLSAALLLARKGRRVLVIDRAARPGGLASAEVFRGLPCDLGSHRIHPEALADPLLGEIHAARPFLSRPRRGVLLFADRRLPYPPDALSMLCALGLRGSLSLGAALAAAGAKWEHGPAPCAGEGDVGFARFVTERVGEPAYRAFYKPYAEKVWGLDPRELSQTVAKKRISTTRPWSLLGRSRFVYPARGIASIIGYLEEQLAREGVPIELGRPFDRREANGRAVLFAGNLGDLVETPLGHRGLYLVYLALPVARVGVNSVARLARILSYLAMFATALLVIALYDEDTKIALAVVTAVPAVVLFLFSTALREAADLPARLRAAPADAVELQQSLAELSRARRGRLLRALFRTGRAAAGASDLVRPWAPLLPLVNVWFLVATLASALVTPLLVLGALVVFAAYV